MVHAKAKTIKSKRNDKLVSQFSHRNRGNDVASPRHLVITKLPLDCNYEITPVSIVSFFRETIKRRYLLILTGTDEHRLSLALIDSIQSALRSLHANPPSPSAVLITTAHGKFFSNGYDLSWANSAGSKSTAQSRFQLMSSKFRSLLRDLISVPMPTIAAVTGHAAAGGMIFALCHDYVVMRKDRGFLYMSELDIGLVVPEWFMAVLRYKIGDRGVVREAVLEAAKLTGDMAVERGIVDAACEGAEATVEKAVALGEELVRRKWDGHVYAKNRRVMMAEVVDKMAFDETVEEDDGNFIIMQELHTWRCHILPPVSVTCFSNRYSRVPNQIGCKDLKIKLIKSCVAN